MVIAGDAEVLKRGTGPCATLSATKPTEKGTESSPPPICAKTQRSNPRNAARTVLEYSLVDQTSSATDRRLLRASLESQNAPVGFAISFRTSVCPSTRPNVALP